MDFLEDIAPWFFGLWFITIPLFIGIIYTVVTELLDLIFNTGRINEMLKHSDNLDIDSMKAEFEHQKVRQSNLSSANLEEVKRQVEFSKLQSTRGRWRYPSPSLDKEKIVTAKNLSDIFRIDK
jgi:hypothetical protein